MKRLVIVLVALGAAVAVAVIAFFLLALSGGELERGEHLAHVDWLPAEATDVTYAKRDGFGWFTCYECSLSKDAFDRFSQKQRWSMEPKNNVTSGLRLVLFPSPPREHVERDGVIIVDPEHKSDANESVSRALFYEKRYPNGGGTTVIYDLERNRLFVCENHR